MIQPFIDKIKLTQTHLKNVHLVNDGHLTSTDINGKTVFEISKRLILEGSYSTKVTIRAYEHTVELTANFSRINRPDNYVGYTLTQTLTLANKLLSSVLLPIFTQGKTYISQATGKTEHTGAKISLLDITQNNKTGSLLNAYDFLYSASRLKLDRIPVKTFPAQGRVQTILHGSKRSGLKIKIYLKSAEYKAHRKSQKLPVSRETDQLFKHLEDDGIIRIELTLNAAKLKKLGFDLFGQTTNKQITNYFQEVNPMKEHEAKLQDINNLPLAVQATYLRYMQGEEPRSFLTSQRQFYDHRKAIKAEFNIDIAVKSNIVPMPVRTKTIYLTPISLEDLPEGYEMPPDPENVDYSNFTKALIDLKEA